MVVIMIIKCCIKAMILKIIIMVFHCHTIKLMHIIHMGNMERFINRKVLETTYKIKLIHFLMKQMIPQIIIKMTLVIKTEDNYL